ncbi:MAG: tetratricopeptide repeat protein [Candidatus Eisenbacteria bacterium]|nr:tetratricopeptide repeat protein [Candidatus Eisenbacteria bacterium]
MNRRPSHSRTAPVSDEPHGVRPLRWTLTVLLALQAIASLVPGPLLWGINHLAWAPRPAGVVWPLLGILLVWTWLGEAWGRILCRFVGGALLGCRWLAYGLVPLAGMILFGLARVRTHLLGDGWLLSELIAAGTPFSGYEFLSYHLHARLFATLDLSGQAAAQDLFAVTSILSGGAYLIAAAYSARALASDSAGRTLLYALWIWHTPLLLFLGYVECYAFLTVALLLCGAQLVRYYEGQAPPRAPAIALAIGLFFHLNALFLAPLLLLALLRPPGAEARSFARRLLQLAGPPLLALSLGVLIYLLSGYDRDWFAADFEVGQRFVRPLAALHGDHGLLSLVRWKDFLNLLLLLAPVPLAILVSTGSRRARTSPAEAGAAPQPRTGPILLTGCLWLLLLMAGVNYKLGMVRDWDLFAAHSALFVLAAWLRIRPHLARGAAERWIGVIAGSAIVLTAPWFWLNAGQERAYRRVRATIADLPGTERGYAFEEIGKFLRARERTAEAIDAYRQSLSANPGHTRVRAVLGALYYNSGRYDQAIDAFHEVLDRDSTILLARETLARAHAKAGHPDSALFHARRLAGHPDEPVAAAEFHGELAEAQGRIAEAAAAFERAYRQAPQRTDLLERIGGLGLQAEDHALAERVFRTVLRREPRSVSARVGLLIALWEPLRDRPPETLNAAQRERAGEALALLTGLVREGQASPGMQSWRPAMEAARGGGARR